MDWQLLLLRFLSQAHSGLDSWFSSSSVELVASGMLQPKLDFIASGLLWPRLADLTCVWKSWLDTLYFDFLRHGFSVALEPVLVLVLIDQAGLKLKEICLPLLPEC